MKIVVGALAAIAALSAVAAAPTAASAQPYGYHREFRGPPPGWAGPHYYNGGRHWHNRAQNCVWRHHRQVCTWRYF